MSELLNHLFAQVCGQNPEHTWVVGRMLLPCCQRCTGLYVGAGIAALLHLWVRPRMTVRFLQIHGGFLLLMVPFGYHWLPQGPVLRTLTGVLFGFGLVAYLSLPGREPASWVWRKMLASRHDLHSAERMTSPSSRLDLRPAGGMASRSHPILQEPSFLYGLGLVAVLVLLPFLAAQGREAAVPAISILLLGGFWALGLLVVADLSLACWAAARWIYGHVVRARLMP